MAISHSSRRGFSMLAIIAVVAVISAIIAGVALFALKKGGDPKGEEPKTEESKPAPSAMTVVDVYPGTRGWTKQEIGTSSTQVSTFTNSGTEPFVVTKIAADGDADLTQTNDCPAVGAPLLPGTSCTMTIVFAPTKTGEQNTVFSMYGNVKDGRAIVFAHGTGITSEGLNPSPGELRFSDDVSIGKSSSPLSLTITNAGGSTIAIKGISTTGDFYQTNACPGSLAPKGTCTVSVAFKPTETGLRNGSVVVTDSGTGSPHSVPLYGYGTAAGLPLADLAGDLSFGAHDVGTTTMLSWKLRNTGSGSLVIKKVSAEGSSEFTQSNDCGSTLSADASCAFTVAFAPTSAGKKTGGVVIEHNATGGKTVLFLSGEGAALPVPSPEPAPAPEPETAPASAPGTLQFVEGEVTVHEADGTATVNVTRTDGSDGTVTVGYLTSDGTAGEGSDYSPTGGTLTFGPGVTSLSFRVAVLEDGEVEGDETVNLILQNATGGAMLGTSQATLTIVDDTPPSQNNMLNY